VGPDVKHFGINRKMGQEREKGDGAGASVKAGKKWGYKKTMRKGKINPFILKVWPRRHKSFQFFPLFHTFPKRSFSPLSGLATFSLPLSMADTDSGSVSVGKGGKKAKKAINPSIRGMLECEWSGNAPRGGGVHHSNFGSGRYLLFSS
jgi:hypothetical protein